MTKLPPQPPAWRVTAAFLLTPALAAAVLAAALPLYAGLPHGWERVARTFVIYALVGAYPLTLLVGVPAYLVLRHNLRPSVWNCAWVGALTAALPAVALSLLSNPTYASVGQHVTHLNGIRTLWGWIELAKVAALLSVPGAFGGVVFWLIAAAGHRATPGRPMSPADRRT